MTTVKVRAIRDQRQIRWAFEWSDDLAEFAEQWAAGALSVWSGKAVVLVVGKHAGLIAMDWLRDRDFQPVIVR